MWTGLMLGSLAAWWAGGDAESKVTIEGRLLHEGQHVTSAIVGLEWVSHPLLGRLAPLYPFQVDREGRFHGQVEANALRCAVPYVIAMDWSRGLGGWATIDRTNPADPVTVELHKLVDVSGSLDFGTLPVEEPSVSLSVAPKGKPPLLPVELRDRSFVIPLPPGTYELDLSGLLIQRGVVPFEVRAGVRRVDLGEIVVQPSFIGRTLGKPMPEWVAEHARGLPRGVRLADLRGRWILIELWNVSCPPCILYSLPRLAEFYRDFADQHDRFEIIALHSGGAPNFEELERRLAAQPKAVRLDDLPFPVLLDVSGRTMKQWKLSSYPTLLLIDPQGRLVRIKSGVTTMFTSGAGTDRKPGSAYEKWSRWPERHPLGHLARRLRMPPGRDATLPRSTTSPARPTP